MSEEIGQQYPGLVTRLQTYLQWSYGVIFNLPDNPDLFAKVTTEFFTKEEKNPSVEATLDRFLQHGILEAFKAQRLVRSWSEEIPKLYRFTMEQLIYLIKEIQNDNGKINSSKAFQIQAQYRELRLYEARTIALTGDNFNEADDVDKHRSEINVLSVEALLPGIIQQDYKETLGDENTWAEDVSSVEYDYNEFVEYDDAGRVVFEYLADGLAIYDFKRFWTPYPEEGMLENGLLDFLANLWDIQQRIGSDFPNPTASQVFESVGVLVAADFHDNYEKLVVTEDEYRQAKKDIKNPSLKPLTKAIDSLLRRIHEEGITKEVIPLDWIRPVVTAYSIKFQDRIQLDSGNVVGKAISDAEGFQMLQDLCYVDAYLNSIYRRFALVLFPRLLREIELDDRNAKKEAAKDRAKLGRGLAYQEQVKPRTSPRFNTKWE